MDDVVRGRQVEPQAAGLEADEKEIALAGLKGVDLALPVLGRGGAVEIAVGDVACVQVFADQGEMADELAEDQGLVAVFQQFGHHLAKEGELGAGNAGSRAGSAADGSRPGGAG